MLTFILRVPMQTVAGSDAGNEFYLVAASNERDALATLRMRLDVPRNRVTAIEPLAQPVSDLLGLKEGQIGHWVTIIEG